MTRRHAIFWLAAIGGVVVVGLWCLTLRKSIAVHNFRGLAAGVCDGAVFVSRAEMPGNQLMLPGPMIVELQGNKRVLWVPRFGAMLWKPWTQIWQGATIVVVPLWLPLVGVLIPEVIARAKGWGRPAPGACRKCGYDLQGLRGSRKCPECGVARGGAG